MIERGKMFAGQEKNRPSYSSTIFSILLLAAQIANQVNSLNNGLALTPPMGWIPWNRYLCTIDCELYPNDCVNSDLFKKQADWLLSHKLDKVGYNYINIDDCWQAEAREPDSEVLMPDSSRFPAGGIKELSDYIHGKGLKLGIYGDCGTKTCQGYPAQLKSEDRLTDNYFKLDAETMAKWEVDSFKFDGCYLDAAKAESICPEMSKALIATKRPILMNCEWPDYMMLKSLKINWTLAAEACNLWRYYIDIEDSWTSVLGVIDFTVEQQQTIKNHHGPGSWFDPDQLVIGNFGLSLEQERAQMAIWSIWSAPLYMSSDLSKLRDSSRDILANIDLIEINQDRLGVFGMMVQQRADFWTDLVQVFAKPIEPIKNGCPSFAIVYLNRATLGNGAQVSFKLRDLLKNSAIHMAALRYNKLYGEKAPGGKFSGNKCMERINKAMSRDANSIKPSQLVIGGNSNKYVKDIKDEIVHYDVYDLLEHKSLGRLGLDQELDLWVNISGVRAVRLMESNQFEGSTSVQN